MNSTISASNFGATKCRITFFTQHLSLHSRCQIKKGSCRQRILSALDLRVRPRKFQKYYIFSIGQWKYLDQRGATHSGIRAIEVPFLVKLTKMPMVSPRLTESKSWLKSSQTKFFMFIHQTWATWWFSSSLTRGWLSRALETLILMWLSEHVGTNAITKIIKFPFQWLFMSQNQS